MVELRGGRAPIAAMLAADAAGHSRFMGEDKAATLARLAGAVLATCDVSDGLVADLAHVSDTSHAGAAIEVTALRIPPQARRIIAEDPDHVRWHGARANHELVFASPPEASLVSECPLPELAWRSPEPPQSKGMQAGARLGDSARKRLPVGGFEWQHL